MKASELPFTEGEIQLLIACIELSEPVETPNNTHYTCYPQTLEEAGQYFRGFREDWQPATHSLQEKGLLEGVAGVPVGMGVPIEASTPRLTPAGVSAAREWRLARPPIYYWYREYYTVTQHSRVYDRFCEQLYGKNLCQTNFSDMAQLDRLLEVAELKAGSRVLDLGCGKGLIAEYIADTSGACVEGMDYIPEAIQQAQARTRGKQERLAFQVGNLDHLPYPPHSFDCLLSIDTLYMPNNLAGTLRQMQSILRPGGQMLIYYTQFMPISQGESGDPREALRPERTTLGLALQQNGLPFRTWDFSEATYELLQRKHRLAREMQQAFEAEGSLFLYEHVLAESIGSPEPYDPQYRPFSRYLYQAVAV